MYEGVVGTRGLIMWSRKVEMHSVGPLQPLTNRSNSMRCLVYFFEKIHALRSYLVCGAKIGMCMLVYVASLFHAVYYVIYTLGYCSCGV